MAIIRWLGGASTNTQVTTHTPGGNTATTVTYKTTVTGEDGTAVTISTNSSATTVSQIVQDIQSALSATSANNLFKVITWTEDGTKVTGTAKVAGTPFYISTLATSTATTGMTYVTATTTANQGPHDWESSPNWETSTGGNTVPSNTDTVHFSKGSHSLLFGLRPGNGSGNQGGTAISLTKLTRGAAYEGNIGDAENGYYLVADSTTVQINGRADAVLLNTTASSVNVAGTSNSRAAVKLDGDIGNLRLLGTGVNGKVLVADSAVLDNVYVVTTGGQGELEIGDSVTSLDLLEATGGLTTLKSSATTLTINAAGTARVIYDGTATEPTKAINVREQAKVEYNGKGTASTVTLISGTFSLVNSEAEAVTITSASVYGGLWTDRSGLGNVTYTNDINAFGGQVDTETGTVIRYV
jgi:hypothetical protein